MGKSDWCRQQIDKINQECYGGELSADSIRDTKAAITFCKRVPFLKLQSTMSVNKIRTIPDPIVQGKVLEMVKGALLQGIDPRSQERFNRSNGAMCITTPMISWMIKYAETGKKPPYLKRGSRVKSVDPIEILSPIDELLALKIDRRLGFYPVTEEHLNKFRAIREKLCSLA